MNCTKAQKLLSAYHDGELSAEVRASLDEHLQGCSPCAAELAAFRKLSAVVREAADPAPPGRLWGAIQLQLDAEDRPAAGVADPRRPVPARRLRSWKLLAAAVAFVLALGLGWFAAETWFRPSGHDQRMAVDFGAYLDAFQESPQRSQQFLLARYHGRAIDAAEAARQLGRPEAALVPPAGYSLDGVYQLNMPCCTCVQWCLRREDGSIVTVFEHGQEQPVHFGDRPATTARCDGRDCRVVCGQGTMLASWKAGGRQFTVVGARDLDEVARLMAHLEKGA